MEDLAKSLVLDGSGNVYVAGYSTGNGTKRDFTTIKYDGAGNQLWLKRYNSPGNENDEIASMAIDSQGNVCVTGRSLGDFSDYLTMKYNASGAELWMKRYDGPAITGDDDEANALAVDASGNVYVTGYSSGNGTSFDYATIKYDAAGAELWVKRYNSPGNGYDNAYALAVDTSGNVYVTGVAKGDASYTVVKYSQVSLLFTLINADSNEDIKELRDGDTINLASPRITMRANTSPAVVGSVLFRLSGPFSRRHIENTAPYALFANRKGNYYGRAFPAGNYTLTATPYSAAKGKGDKGTPLIVHFTVTNTIASSLTQADATSVQESKILKNNTGINLEALPNPFASQTTIRFSVPTSGYTTVQVYDSKGLVVERLYQAWAERGKTYQVTFKGKGLQSGVYMLRVITGKQMQSGKLVLIR